MNSTSACLRPAEAASCSESSSPILEVVAVGDCCCAAFRHREGDIDFFHSATATRYPPNRRSERTPNGTCAIGESPIAGTRRCPQSGRYPHILNKSYDRAFACPLGHDACMADASGVLGRHVRRLSILDGPALRVPEASPSPRPSHGPSR
jgi:hypothetical protein